MNDYRAYVENDYNAIYHHGIKGQRWGIRRYQNEDGSLTPLGRKHYGYLIKQYKKAGMSDKEIEEAIAKRNKIMKGAVIGAGVAAAGIGAYYLRKHLGGKYLDKTIKAGSKIKTVASDANRLKNQHFYSSKGILDESKYVGELGEKKDLFGDYLGEYKKLVTHQAKENVKVASEKSQLNAFKKLMQNDKDFSNDFKKYYVMNKGQLAWLENKGAIRGNDLAWKLKEGEINTNQLSKNDWRDLNNFFNLAQVGRADEFKRSQRKYFNELKKQGYGGMVDLNDSLNNSFHTKSAAIIFDNDKFMQTSVKDLNVEEVNKARVLNILAANGDANLPYVPFWVLGAGGMVASSSDDKVMRDAKKRNNRK